VLFPARLAPPAARPALPLLTCFAHQRPPNRLNHGVARQTEWHYQLNSKDSAYEDEPQQTERGYNKEDDELSIETFSPRADLDCATDKQRQPVIDEPLIDDHMLSWLAQESDTLLTGDIEADVENLC